MRPRPLSGIGANRFWLLCVSSPRALSGPSWERDDNPRGKLGSQSPQPKPSTFSGSRNQRGLPSGLKRNQTDVPKKGPTLSRKLISNAAVLALLVSGGLCFSQDLEAKYKEKQEKEFVKKISWIQSLEEAQKVSAKTGKPIFGYFTRSYVP